jgi:hypothetical protein
MQNLAPTTKKVLIGLGVLVAVAVIAYLIYYFVAPTTEEPTTSMMAAEVPTTTAQAMAMAALQESFDTMPPASHMVAGSGMEGFQGSCGARPPVAEGFQVSPADNSGVQETQQGMSTGDNGLNQLPSECYPKDVLNSSDLLPQDPNSTWSQAVPNGQGALNSQNFLTAGFHIGINTVGQTLRNANRQLRSEPPNPMVKVSPWNQTTIEPDIARRPLEIGGDA